MDIEKVILESYVPIIVLFCLVVGFVIKKVGWIPNKFIPLIMFVVGAISGIIVIGFTYQGITFGAVSGVASTGFHQLFKQIINDKDDDE